jgi:hypothetical protein
MSTFLCSLRPGPAAASWFGGWAGAWGESWVGVSRDRACAGREALGDEVLSRCARWGGLIASYARSGPVPLLLGGSVLQEGSGKVRRSECPNGAPHTSPG